MRYVSSLIVILLYTSCANHEPDTSALPDSDTGHRMNMGDTPQVLSNSNHTIQGPRNYPDAIYEDDIQKAQISNSDSSFFVYGNIRKDYRIFGYSQPDTNSKRLILFSVFTRDVENNPYKCTYGAFYGTDDLEDAEIRFVADKGAFAKTQLIIKGQVMSELYFEKKWIEFVK